MSEASPGDAPPRSLGSAAALGVARVGAAIISLSVTALLMRRLGPAPFGLVAMASGLMTIVSVLGDAGLRDSLVSEQELCERRVGAALLASVALAGAFVLLSLLTAPLVAALYQRPAVGLPWVAAGVTVALHLLAVVPAGLAWRGERFFLISGVSLGAAALAGGAALALALVRDDLWPILVWQGAAPCASLLALWLAVRPRAAWPDRPALRGLWGFSRGVLGFQGLNVLNRNADDVVIGRFLGERALGLYSLCYRVLIIPLGLVSDVFSTLAYPRLARLRDRAQAAQGMGLQLHAVALVSTPLAICLALAGGELLEVVFGHQWLEALVPFRVLALLSAVGGPARLMGLAYRLARDTDAMARWAVVATPWIVGSFFAGLPWGITGVAVAYALVSLALFPLNCRHAARALQAPAWPLIAGTAKGIGLGALLSGGLVAACLVARALAAPAWAVLVTTLGACALTELLALWIARPALGAGPAPAAR
ncbi:MAG: oligosaccharide flippase family protein [Planctomycetota bacterium]